MGKKLIDFFTIVIGTLLGIIYSLDSIVDLVYELTGNPDWDIGLRIARINWLNYRLFVVLPL